MAPEKPGWDWYSPVLAFAAGSFLTFIASAYISAHKEPEYIVKMENPALEASAESRRKSEKTLRELILNNAQIFLMQGNADDARKNIDHYLTMNPAQEERLKALKLLDKVATYHRENNRPEQCAAIYRLVSEIAPDKVKEVMDPQNVGLAKSLEALAQDSH